MCKEQYEYVDHNIWYQYGLAIKTYAGFNTRYKLPVSIEHGIHLFDNNDIIDTNIHIQNNLPGLFVLSEDRKRFYSKHTNKEIVPIGPPVHYARPLLGNNAFAKEKKRLGKSLLVMPAHSDVYAQVVNGHEYIDRVKQIAKDFDSVRVCLYYLDIKWNLHKQYEEMGWECICAGHERSHLFMSRLRSIIELSDFVVANNYGSWLGYSIYLNKPVMLIKTPMKLLNTSKGKFTDGQIEKAIYHPIVDMFFQRFSHYDNKITEGQRELVEKHWGLSLIKNQQEMRDIIMHFDVKMKESKYA
jgi:hypothetical protein